MYMYSYPVGQPDAWWWHDCQRLGAWVRVCRNRDLPKIAWNEPGRRLCPFCNLQGRVQTHRPYGMQDPCSEGVYLEDTRRGWYYARPGGGRMLW